MTSKFLQSLPFVLLAAVLLCLPAFAQDCQQTTNFTAAGAGASYQVTNRGCSFWIMVYQASGFNPLSLSFQAAEDTGAGPGTWADVPASTPTTNGVVYGSNPQTTITGDGPLLVRGFYGFVRVNLGTATGAGQVKVSLYGWRAPQPGFLALLVIPDMLSGWSIGDSPLPQLVARQSPIWASISGAS